MNEQSKIKVNDNEAAKLFLHFYKLLFLGSPFAEKLLHIKLEDTKGGPNIDKQNEEELKGDVGGFVIDTSDVTSSDGGSLLDNKNSPN